MPYLSIFAKNPLKNPNEINVLKIKITHIGVLNSKVNNLSTMNISITTKGLEEYMARVKQAPEKASVAIEGAMKTFTIKVKSDIQKSLNIREKSGKVFIPSAPGTPPHKRTGHLFKSVYNNIEKSGKKITGTVGDNADYAVALEYGHSTSKSFVPPRPYIRPAVDKNADLFEKSFKIIFDRI